jgi:hypothetical protein
LVPFQDEFLRFVAVACGSTHSLVCEWEEMSDQRLNYSESVRWLFNLDFVVLNV